MKIIHLTDTHIVRKGQLLFGLDPFAHLTEAVASIRLNHSDADLCVITGDLTESGREHEYTAFKEVISGLPMPVQLLIGNHDNRVVFRESFPQTPIDAHGFVQSQRIFGNDTLMFLDTHEPADGAGRYCERRLTWLRDRLEEHRAEGRRAILFMHHPPVKIGIIGRDSIMLRDHAAFADVLQNAGIVAYIIFGHVHRSVSGIWKSIPFSATRGTNHQSALDLSVTGEEIQITQEQPMYGVMLLDDDSIVYHTHEFADPASTLSAASLTPRWL